MGDLTATCPHDDDPLTCPPCQGRNPLVRAHRPDREHAHGGKWSDPFPAAFTTRCACGEPIKPGEPARTRSDEWGDRWTVHAECAGEVA